MAADPDETSRTVAGGLRPAAVLTRLVAIGVLLALLAGGFAWAGGWLSPGRLSPDAIVDALSKLREAAARAGSDDVVAFAEALVEHAQTEEAFMYPAAILVGQVVRQRLGALAAGLA